MKIWFSYTLLNEIILLLWLLGWKKYEREIWFFFTICTMKLYFCERGIFGINFSTCGGGNINWMDGNNNFHLMIM